MNPNLLSYILRKNLINLRKGRLSQSRYNHFIGRSFGYLNNSSFKNKRRKAKKEILFFKRQLK